MLSSLLEKELVSAQDIIVSDISEERSKYIEKKYGIQVTGNKAIEVIKHFVRIVLAMREIVEVQNLIVIAIKLKNDGVDRTGGEKLAGNFGNRVVFGQAP